MPLCHYGAAASTAIVSQVPAGFLCRSAIPVIDRIDSWRRGAVALWLDRDGVTIEGVNEKPRRSALGAAFTAGTEGKFDRCRGSAGRTAAGVAVITGGRFRPHRHGFINDPDSE